MILDCQSFEEQIFPVSSAPFPSSRLCHCNSFPSQLCVALLYDCQIMGEGLFPNNWKTRKSRKLVWNPTTKLAQGNQNKKRLFLRPAPRNWRHKCYLVWLTGSNLYVGQNALRDAQRPWSYLDWGVSVPVSVNGFLTNRCPKQSVSHSPVLQHKRGKRKNNMHLSPGSRKWLSTRLPMHAHAHTHTHTHKYTH